MKPLAYLIDDDDAIRDSLGWLLESRGIESRAWPSAESFLEFRNTHAGDLAGCMILDIRMDGMSGLELFDRLLQSGCKLPVIFLTGHGDVPMAVGALKNGAFDFFEKPFDDAALVKRVGEAMALDAGRRAGDAGRLDTEARLASLSERERQVMEQVLAGKLNKVIADDLSISMRTVEVHRSRVFEKMGVKSAVELAQRLKDIER
jgi:two-component system response regulator DctR